MLQQPWYLCAFGMLALAAAVGELSIGHEWASLLPLPVVCFVQYRLTRIALGKL